jgi:hypothetical protein
MRLYIYIAISTTGMIIFSISKGLVTGALGGSVLKGPVGLLQCDARVVSK